MQEVEFCTLCHFRDREASLNLKLVGCLFEDYELSGSFEDNEPILNSENMSELVGKGSSQLLKKFFVGPWQSIALFQALQAESIGRKGQDVAMLRGDSGWDNMRERDCYAGGLIDISLNTDNLQWFTADGKKKHSHDY